MQLDKSKIAAAKLILAGPSAVISKATRSGFTTSAAAALDEMGIPALIVAPTNKIVQSTVREATSSFLPVLAHKNCDRVKGKLQKDPFLENLPITIPDCMECRKLGDCPVFAARTDWAMTTSMTYAKLQALALANSDESQQIRRQLSDRIRVVIFDESHTIGRGNGATIDYDATIVIPEDLTSRIK